jgi:cis-L-3-hydroxyproline dehydratase
MFLTDEEKRMVQGEVGPGIQKAISLLIKYGELFGAEKMVRVTGCHISPDVPNALLEKYTEGVDKVKPICSLHPCLYPEETERIIGRAITKEDCMADGYVSLDSREYNFRMELFKRLGFLPTSTCVPYLIGLVPRHNDVVAWTGSAGQVTCNSVFGGTANRDGHSSALASAVTGRTPDIGLLRQKNRYAKVVIRVDGLDTRNFNIGDYGALGYYIGMVAGTRNVVVEGLPNDLSLEQCKYLLSPLPVSGGCTMCHIVGVTPEAPTLAAALGGKKPEETISVRKMDIEDAYQRLNSAKNDQVDHVALGCPHLSIQEIKNIARSLEGKKVHRGLRLLLATAKPIYNLAKTAGFVAILEQAGGEFVDFCIATGNPLIYLSDVKVTMTNSTRAAHYIQRMTKEKVQTIYTDTASCLDAAITGRAK